MLGGKKPDESQARPANTIDTLIGEGAELKGDIIFSGGLRIDGKIRGNVTAKGDSSSMLVVSDKGEVDGSVNVPHVTINGAVNGNLNSSGTVELQPNARITGDVNYRQLKMELGASVNGNLACDRDKPSAASPLKTPMSVTKEAVKN
ncbi:MAG: polymer-forming cytoskeletal protein [Gammaproteobacteria bacterium]|nr:polymer-forming cytoskeletal protein [Gammaproteobacteria bacterium]